MPTSGIILLAAGASTRLGSAKQLVEFHGVPLIVHAAQTALATACCPVIAVLGADAARFEPLVSNLKSEISNLKFQIVTNPDWSLGMGTSIRTGMQALQGSSVDAVMILLCDQPLITANHLNQMTEAFFASGKTMCAARYAGALGTPAIFSRVHFDELKTLGDAQGGKAILQRYPTQVHAFNLPEAAIDLDTPDDLRSLARARGG
jgi:molybdenum cofactor cytidylyltransferase